MIIIIVSFSVASSLSAIENHIVIILVHCLLGKSDGNRWLTHTHTQGIEIERTKKRLLLFTK